MQIKSWRWVALWLIASLLPLPAAQAALVSTDQMAPSSAGKQRLQALLSRADVQRQLQHYGVNPDEAKARVNALTDEEAKNLAGKIDALPAGGVVGEILGAALIIFIVLLITDILGFTKVFPFTRPVKR
ncbi:MAG: PA2779 family protein [Burkholderiales bacterium]